MRIGDESFMFLTRRSVGLFRDEVAGNLMLQRMLWVIACLLMLYGLSALQYAVDELADDAKRLHAELSRVSGTGEEEVWISRLKWERNLQEQLLRGCWSAGDSKIASAEMQTFLQQLSSKRLLRNSRLQLAEPEEIVGGGESVWVVRGQLRGRMDKRVLPGILEELESNENPLVVEQLLYQDSKGAGLVDLTAAACFRNEK